MRHETGLEVQEKRPDGEHRDKTRKSTGTRQGGKFRDRGMTLGGKYSDRPRRKVQRQDQMESTATRPGSKLSDKTRRTVQGLDPKVSARTRGQTDSTENRTDGKYMDVTREKEDGKYSG